MDFHLRLKALTRLAKSKTEKAAFALEKEFRSISAVLKTEDEYEILEQQFTLLDAIGYRFSQESTDILINFIQTIESREIAYSQQEGWADVRKYHNAFSLIVRAIEVLTQLRYLETIKIMPVLIELSMHESETVHNKALESLKALAGYNINVFYGYDGQVGIAAAPQKQIVDYLVFLSDPELNKFLSTVLIVTGELLSPTMHATSWASKTVTWSQGAVPATEDTLYVRHQAIELLKRMYISVDKLSKKLQIIEILNDVTRAHHTGETSAEVTSMIERDSVVILEYYADLILTEELSVIQKIEHNSYWIYFHAVSGKVEDSALSIQEAISKHAEYQIFKTLIGYEGVFGDWASLKKVDSLWEKDDALRKEKAIEYAASISSLNYEEWRGRIIKYSETNSDDLATFPVFYLFLEKFAANQSGLALQFISTDSDKIERFLIPLLRGLWYGSKRDEIQLLIGSWIEQGAYLYQCAKLFLDNDHLDQSLLFQILNKAIEKEDFSTVTMLMSVVVSNYNDDTAYMVDTLFIPALKALTVHSYTNWIFDFWFRRESKVLISNLNDSGIDLILQNLCSLEKIDYHSEEILYLIAQREPLKVFHFLCQRLTERPQRKNESSSFEALPFGLHKLNEPLSQIPKEAVQMIREQCYDDYGLFIFHGARLLQMVFSEFQPEFEMELLNVVGNGEDLDFKFVLGILRNYKGEPFIHHVCKEVIKGIPVDSPLRTEVAISLESIGVVSGEFGLVEAYQRKKDEVNDWVEDPDEKIREFAKWYIENLDQMIDTDTKRVKEEMALRKHSYGEDE